jgi:glycosyltransferase involved in cell wall biosynthesis
MRAVAVSCIVPVFNGERFLRDALESVLAQTRPPDEIIVVDDGSSDGSAAIARSFGDAVIYMHQNNAGASAARNAGIRRARGSLVALQDADDLWLPEKLERQLACLSRRPELGFCVVHSQNFWMPELEAEARAFADQPFAGPLPAFTFQSLLARRGLFETVGPINESLRTGGDVDWFLRAREAGVSHELLPEVLLRRRLHSNNLTRVDLASRESLVRSLKSSLDRRRQGAS